MMNEQQYTERTRYGKAWKKWNEIKLNETKQSIEVEHSNYSLHFHNTTQEVPGKYLLIPMWHDYPEVTTFQNKVCFVQQQSWPPAYICVLDASIPKKVFRPAPIQQRPPQTSLNQL